METLSIVNKIFELYKLIIDINGHLEKKWRYSIGQSLEKEISDCLSAIIMSKNAPKNLKPPYLLKASSHIEISIFKIRILLELKVINETKLFQAQKRLIEIGKMTGGWLKSLQ